MTKLQCSATNCCYNDDRYCSKGDIMVEGRGAKNAKDTCCSSFQERRGDSARNSVGKATPEIDVDCRASNCVHNEDCKCNADHIGIGGVRACQCGETECMSFCCK